MTLPSVRLPYGTSTPLNHQQQDSSDEEFKIPPPKPRLKPGFQNLKKSFLEPQELFDTVNTLKPLYCTIPSGEKNNVFFTLKNDWNIKNRQKKGKADYTDDCGAWESKTQSTKKTEFLLGHNGLEFVVKKNDVWCKRRGNSQPLEPQPLAEDVVILKRSYATLKRDSTYKRRISWFENLPIKYKEKSQIAVVEYLGCLPNSYSIHGNTRKTEAAYKKTPAVKEAIENGLTHGAKPFNLYSDQLLNNSDHCPRNLKQVYNIKQKVQREARKVAGEEDGHRQNSADHIQAVMKMFGQNPYIQDIVHIPGKPPGFILYTEQQMKDVADFCTLSQGLQNVLGIDRTFNLGECYVTGRLDTLALSGAELAISDLIVGSDEEKALTKAIQRCFSDVSLILCTPVNWKPEKLPDLVDKLHRIVKTQYADMRRALRGEGNFQLAPAFSKFKITISAWNNKTEDEKEACFTKFLNAKIKDDNNYITSTDGQLSIPKPQRLAKKPGQKTRATRTRTTSIK
ncbi:hypothetical protein O3P69_020379 [Scylla paramamosain]|uniref:Uncharacterized protein n=1 Tax=Scylla paramamosain TaxID=85552 RepID=A0AAW0TKU0_SCYPA